MSNSKILFLKSLELWRHSSQETTTTQEPSIADKKLLSALGKVKADIGSALCDCFNCPVVLRESFH
ncbi:hypothetical protein F5Y14DRAFT_422217 [Nemania sp. NC0429]|nr:hypothetical protein F5Y14DRAFT_422217 [Nemania sp. NC0429]